MIHSLNTLTTKWQQTSLLTKALMGAVLIYISSKISIPLKPVPITFQPFAVFLIALTHSPRETASAIGLYLVAGLAGLPVFTVSGPGVLFSPTMGYLAGFLVGGYVASYIASRSFQPVSLRLSLAVIAGSICLYTCGIMGLLRFCDLSQALQVGVLPFIIPGMIKSGLLVAALAYVKKR